MEFTHTSVHIISFNRLNLIQMLIRKVFLSKPNLWFFPVQIRIWALFRTSDAERTPAYNITASVSGKQFYSFLLAGDFRSASTSFVQHMNSPTLDRRPVCKHILLLFLCLNIYLIQTHIQECGLSLISAFISSFYTLRISLKRTFLSIRIYVYIFFSLKWPNIPGLVSLCPAFSWGKDGKFSSLMIITSVFVCLFEGAH